MAKDSDQLYELIEAWLDGRLAPDEAAALAEQLETDESLRFRVEQHRLAREVIGHWAAEDYKTKIKAWKQELEEPPPSGGKFLALKWWILGAGLLLLVVVGAFWFFPLDYIGAPGSPHPAYPADTIQNPVQPVPEKKQTQSVATETSKESTKQSPSIEKPDEKPKEQEVIAQEPEKADLETAPEELIAMADEGISAFKAYLDESISTRGENEPAFKAGKDALSVEDFQGAKQNLEQVAESSPNYTAALQWLAYTYYKEKDYAKAVVCYERFAPRKYGPGTDWWLVQFYLADYNRSKVKFWNKLDEMIDSPRNTAYREKAIQLKADLEREGIKEE